MGVGFAIYQFNAWRAQKRAEARSKPAGEALVQVHEVCAFVHNWCSIMRIAEAGRAPAGEADGGALDGISWGRDAAEPMLEGLRRVEAQAFVHLDQAERKLIWDAKGLLIQVQLEVRQLERSPQRIPSERVHEVLGGLVRSADDLQVLADAVLRPIAQFGRPPEPAAPRKGGWARWALVAAFVAAAAVGVQVWQAWQGAVARPPPAIDDGKKLGR